MRWLLTASLIAGLAVVPAAAQRGGSGGHGGGFSAPHGFAAPHISGGFNSGARFAPSPVFTQRNFSAPPRYSWNMPGRYTGNQVSRLPYGSPYSRSGSNWGRGRQPYQRSRYRQPYIPYYYANSTYLVPGLLNSYWDYQDNWNAGDDQSASSNQGQVENYGDYGPQGDYEPQPMPYENQQAQEIPPPPPGPSEPLPQAAVTLVFKDGHSQQIHNYAMTKTTLYVLDDAASGRRPEISLDQLDVSATERTNREAGVDFVVPTGAD